LTLIENQDMGQGQGFLTADQMFSSIQGALFGFYGI